MLNLKVSKFISMVEGNELVSYLAKDLSRVSSSFIFKVNKSGVARIDNAIIKASKFSTGINSNNTNEIAKVLKRENIDLLYEDKRAPEGYRLDPLKWREIQHFLKNRIAKKNKKAKNQKEIIGMTVTTALVQMGLKSTNFFPQVLLVDEASQITLPAASVFGLYNAPCTIFFGDDKQMPPIFSIEDSPYSVSIFEYIKKKYPQNATTLNKTYRLNKSICSLINDYFYANDRSKTIFESAQKNYLELNASSFSVAEYQKIADPKISLFCFTHSDSKSTDSNDTEAKMIESLLKDLSKASVDSNQICVVTPYRRQVRNIRATCTDIFKERPIIDTVERVQGIDTDIVIVSLCSSDTNYIKSFSSFLFNKNRMNVMFSRARYKIILFCSENILKMDNYFAEMVKSRFCVINNFISL